MFSPKHFVADPRHVPTAWIFEHYLDDLGERLEGQRVRIKSYFNPGDKTPSMYLYYNTDQKDYRYKCFSTGHGGDGIDLMMHLTGKPFHEMAQIIQDDYQRYLKQDQAVRDFSHMKAAARWQVTGHELRSWTTDDASLWPQFNISSVLLEEYQVKPLACYTMTRPATATEGVKSFTTSGAHIYGYFTRAGELYKIYQPYSKETKFIKVRDYLQGSEQLGTSPKLCIVSSLKDILAVKSLDLRVDLVAPDSENVLLTYEQLLSLQLTHGYSSIMTLLDNDQAGIKNMKLYKEYYNIPYGYLPLSKDPADSIRDHGARVVKFKLALTMERAFAAYTGLTPSKPSNPSKPTKPSKPPHDTLAPAPAPRDGKKAN
jgi:hypothetical protein